MKNTKNPTLSSKQTSSELVTSFEGSLVDAPIFGSYLSTLLAREAAGGQQDLDVSEAQPAILVVGTDDGQSSDGAVDGSGQSEAGVGPLDAQLNDAPILSGLDGDVAAFVEGDGAVRLDVGGDALISDATTNSYISEIVATGFAAPTLGEMVPDGSGRIFVTELPGRINILDPLTGESTLFLDVVSETLLGGEQGFSGLALAPDFATSGTFYVFMTNLDGDNEVRRYQTMSGNPDVADPASMDVILKVPHPAQLHNGGWVGFGPDGYLYVGLGDGALQSLDAQDPNSLNGKMLRIDVSTDDFSDDPLRDYAIPADNPFASAGGRPEIWAMGLRNPFRGNFDPETGYFYIGDVGGSVAEEVNLIRPGEGGLNFGWPNREGTVGPVPAPPEYTDPVLEYLHRPGATAIVGGFVYRGAIAALDGQYIFGDVYGTSPGIGTFWSVPVDSLVAGSTVQETAFTNLTAALAPDQGLNPLLLSFRQDAAGNLYFSTYTGNVVRVSEGGEANFAGGRLTVAITQNEVVGEDQLRIDTSSGITLSNGMNLNSQVRIDGRLIGVVAQNGAGIGGKDLVIDFTSGATLPRVQALLQAISYFNSSTDDPTPGDRTVTFTLSDGLGTSGGGSDTVVATTTVTVAAVDDHGLASNDRFSTDEATAVVGDLSADNGNGVDLDVDGIVVTAVNGSSAAVGNRIALASGALLTVNADGTFVYDVNHAFDTLVSPATGASNSQAQDSFTYTVAGGATATATIDVFGLTKASNILLGTAMADQLDGRIVDSILGVRANDILIGLDGDDVYWVEGSDQVLEGAGGGNDVVYAATSWTLGAGQYVELITGTPGSVAAIALTGNELDNLIVGTAGANRIDGGGGNDRLEGGAGADELIGGTGNDRLDGGAGANVLTGGDGDDIFVGGIGQDSIDGGAGTDSLLLPGTVRDYFAMAEGNGFRIIGPSANDRVTGVEQVILGGQTISMADFVANAFDGLRYIAGYADLIAAFGPNADLGRLHWETYGPSERPLMNFDPLAYLASYSDLLTAYGANTQLASWHHIYYQEGRPTTFDGLRYLASNPDLIDTFGSDAAAATRQYVEQGFAEGRQVTFDGLQYLAANDDLVDIFGYYDTAGATRHYVEHGYAEGRETTFDGLRYLASWNDLLMAYGTDVTAATRHYIIWGHDEGRPVNFDSVAYLLSYADLGNAGIGVDGALRHWVTFGLADARVGDAMFGREQASHDLILGESVSDALAINGDRDWFGIELAAGQQIELTLDGTGFDGTLTVHNSLGQAVAFADVGGPDPDDAALLFTAGGAGTYYLVVDSAAHNGAGMYTLTAEPAIG